MINRAQHGALIRSGSRRNAAFTLALVCALTVTAMNSAQAQTYNVVHNFTGGDDGAVPLAGVTIGRGDVLYGTASEGGGQGYGTVFRLTQSGDDWHFSLLYSFQGQTDQSNDGGAPYARVMIGPDGLLYGTTHSGGDGFGCKEWHGCGSVFRLKPGKSIGPWEETVLYRFGVGGGSNPDYGDVVFDESGNLYGTTRNGGAHLQGAVYELTPTGRSWTEKVLYSFAGTPDGASPLSGPLLDQAGNLYGTTSAGGANGYGTLYQLKASASGWTENVIASFQGDGSDGLTPSAGVIFDSAGHLYGATVSGGSGGGGTVFELSTLSGGGWNLSTLYSLAGPALGGPFRSLVRDSAGNLYGTTSGDGANQWGSVFKLTRSENGWIYTSLHDFTSAADGGTPYGGLAFDSKGNLYGTASAGGTYGEGVVFEITP